MNPDSELIVARAERVPFSRMHLKAAAVLGGGTFFDAYDGLAMATALSVAFASLHIGFVNAGVLLGTAYLGQFAGAILVGALSDRFGRKVCFILSILWFSVFAIASAAAWNFSSLLWLRVVQGLGLGAEIPAASALFSELLNRQGRGRNYIIYQNMFGWGVMLTPLLGAGLIHAFGPEVGWRVVLAAGGLGVLIVPWALRVLPESPRWLVNRGRHAEAETVVSALENSYRITGRTLPEVTPLARPDTAPTHFGELLHRRYRRRTALIWTMFASAYFVIYAFTVWLPILYVQVGGLPATKSLLLTAINGSIYVLSGYLLAAVVDRLGRRRVFIACFAITAAGSLVGVVFAAGLGLLGWPVLLGVTVLMTIGAYPVSIGCYLYGPELFPTRMRGWAVGTASGIQRLATVAAPIVVGALVTTGGSKIAGIAVVFGVLAAVAALAAIAVAWLGTETAGLDLESASSTGAEEREPGEMSPAPGASAT
jgi:MFS transporter, putative metabolite:H+ symporter